MIQRIQSIFILIALLSVILLYYLSSRIPLGSQIVYFSVLNFMLGFVSIFLYRNRHLQYKFCLFNCLFSVAPLMHLCLSYYVLIFQMPIFYLFLINLVCYFLASMFIKKDINLINSIDRLR